LFKELGAFIEWTFKEEEMIVKLMKELFDVEKIEYEIEGKQVTFNKIH
jgi:hypothetical protein